MKKVFNKSVYKDALRRTRLFRILAVIAAFFTAGFDMDQSHMVNDSSEASIVFAILGAFVFLLFLDRRIYSHHSSKKAEFFQTLPVSRREWFVTGFLAELTNLCIYLLAEETANILENRLAERLIGGLFGTESISPIMFGAHFRRLLLLVTIGIVFLTLLAIIRETSYSKPSFAALFVMVYGGYQLMLYFLPEMVEVLSGGVVSVYGSFLYRISLLHRMVRPAMYGGLEPLVAAYDWFAILWNLAVAGVLFFAGLKFAERVKYEYVGAEYRNKTLFHVLLVGLSVIALFPVPYAIFVSERKILYIVLTPVMLFLVGYLLCRLFRETMNTAVIRWMGIALAIVIAYGGVAFAYARLGRILPAQNKIVAVCVDWGMEQYEAELFIDERAINIWYEQAGKCLEDGLISDLPEQNPVSVTFYTKTGRKQYYLTYCNTSELRKEAFFCAYGREPELQTEFSSIEEYERFVSLIPESFRQEVPVYYLNAFGGMTKAEKGIPAGHYEKLEHRTLAATSTIRSNNDFPRDRNDITFSFPTDSEAMAYYYEEIVRPGLQKLQEVREKVPGTTVRVYIRPLCIPSSLSERSALSYGWKKGNEFAGFSIDARTRAELPQSAVDILTDILFHENGMPDLKKELVMLDVYVMDFNGDLSVNQMRVYAGAYKRIVPMEQIKPVLDAMEQVRMERLNAGGE